MSDRLSPSAAEGASNLQMGYPNDVAQESSANSAGEDNARFNEADTKPDDALNHDDSATTKAEDGDKFGSQRPATGESQGARDLKEKEESGIPDHDEEPPVAAADRATTQEREANDASAKKKGPAGGEDRTPLPHATPGYTVKITFNGARNLPIADLNSLSSDPYVIATLTTGLPTRHKEDSPLRFRTPTIRRHTDPDWNASWIVANVPARGFKLKCRVYDEDPADGDDRLGNAHVEVGPLDRDFPGVHEQSFRIAKRQGSKRAYLMRIMAMCFNWSKHLNGRLIVSVELLGRTDEVAKGGERELKEEGGRAYTVGPQYWTQHFSPLLGRMAGTKEKEATNSRGKQVQRYNFQANHMQLRGPVPTELYHRYVEFRPFIKSMYTRAGLNGFVLNHALHHQHYRVYNYDKSTVYGSFDGPGDGMTRKFLDLVHHAKGSRLFTYVITLDGGFYFTETGKEYGIDLLSKHTMHSDVAVYIAFSGEFFVRRLPMPTPPPSPESPSSGHPKSPKSATGSGSKHRLHIPFFGSRRRSRSRASSAASNTSTAGLSNDENENPNLPQDPSHYELIIDNDSGTYRPSGHLLPILQKFLVLQFPQLGKITTLDCVADEEHLQSIKSAQRDYRRKLDSTKGGGKGIVFMQYNHSLSSLGSNTNLSSISSSDESALDYIERVGEARQKRSLRMAGGFTGLGRSVGTGPMREKAAGKGRGGRKSRDRKKKKKSKKDKK